jgi:hypothetical protein
MKIAISIILYNSPIDIIDKNLNILAKQTYLNCQDNKFKIFFSDNDSGKQIDEVNEICKKYHQFEFEFIINENIGFGKANNKIFRKILTLNSHTKLNEEKFSYFLIMNPDGISHPRLLENLINFSQSKNDRGIFEAIQFPVEHPKIYAQDTKETAWCSGCCCLFPVDAFELLGGFDDIFFMYMEDVDISWRARKIGLKCYTVDDALFFHVSQDREISKNQTIMIYKSAYLLAKKYDSLELQGGTLRILKTLLSELEYNVFLQEADKITIINNLDDYKFIANFKHNLYFSEARW